MLGSILILQISQVAGRALFMLFSIWYLNRFLGIEAKGIWTGLFSLFGILGVFSNMGFEVWLSRSAAAAKINGAQAIRLLFLLKTLPWCLCFLIGGYLSFKKGWPAMLVVPFGLALVFDGIGVAQQAVFEGRRKTGAMALMSFMKSGGFAIMCVLPALTSEAPDLWIFAWIFALALFLRLLLGWRAWSLLQGPATQNLGAGTLKGVFLMGAYTLVTVLYFQIDAVMLSHMAGDRITGDYGNAYHFVEGALFISAAVSSVLYPRLVASQGTERALLFDHFFKLLLTVGAAGVVALWTLADPLGTLLAGEAFKGAVRPLGLLAWGLPFMFGNGLLSRWLFSAEREAFALKTAACLAVFNIAGNGWAIPRFGAEGAAAMTLATEGLLFMIWILIGRKSVPLLGYGCAMGLGLALIYALLRYTANPWLAALSAALLFGPLLLFRLKKIHLFSQKNRATLF